jgi:hypothetical protein
VASYDADVLEAALRELARDGVVTLDDVAAAWWRATPHGMDLLTGGSVTEEDARAFVRNEVAPLLIRKVEALGLRVARPGGLRLVT